MYVKELVGMLQKASGVQLLCGLVNAFGSALRDNVQIINMSMTCRQENMNAQNFRNVLKMFENVLLLLKKRR